jgi:hypothetical protein
MNTSLEFETINEKYSTAKYGDFNVLIDMTNGYINATKLCKNGGKQFCHWLENKGSKELIKEFENVENSSKIVIYQVRNGIKFNNINGTYVHPDLIPHIASWISSKFACKVSKIINEWKQSSPENEVGYWNVMGESFKQTKYNHTSEWKEAFIRDHIALEEDGSIEVETPTGFIDVLTVDKIIEVKQEHNWKHALGQVKCYGFYYPNKEKWIYLFDCKYTNKDIINNICKFEDVFVKYL